MFSLNYLVKHSLNFSLPHQFQNDPLLLHVAQKLLAYWIRNVHYVSWLLGMIKKIYILTDG